MTIQQIGYFLKLAEELNFTTVAKIFFITQPTLSRQIVNLENELGVALFDRDHNNVQLTKEGRHFYQRVNPIFLDLMSAVREVQNMNTDSRQLVIGIQEEQLISASFLLGINKLRFLHPELKVEIHRSQTEELIEGLSLGKYDVINTVRFPNIDYDDFRFLELESECSHVVGAKALEGFDRDIITKQEFVKLLDRYSLILPQLYVHMDDTGAKKMLLENLQISNDSIRVVQSGRPISLPVQVSAQLGISLCNKTNIFSIDPTIKMMRIQGMEGSYIKGLFSRKQPGNLYLKELFKLVLEEKDKETASALEKTSVSL